MAQEKKLVESITSRDVDFAQWYTDVVKKAELTGYTSVKGCMVFKPAGYAIWENIRNERRLHQDRPGRHRHPGRNRYVLPCPRRPITGKK